MHIPSTKREQQQQRHTVIDPLTQRNACKKNVQTLLWFRFTCVCVIIQFEFALMIFNLKKIERRAFLL